MPEKIGDVARCLLPKSAESAILTTQGSLMTDPEARSEAALESWKEIAAYLGRQVKTVQRWEKDEGLPVHRHSHKARASVYAYRSEIDEWRESRKTIPEPIPSEPRNPWPLRVAMPAAVLMALVMLGDAGPEILRVRAQGAPKQTTSRVLWEGEGVDLSGTVSGDGRALSYTDWTTDGNIAVRDLATGINRRLTDEAASGSYAEASAISRDGSQIAYSFLDRSTKSYGLRVVNTRRSLRDPSRHLYKNDEVSWLKPMDWSPDGRWIAIQALRKDRSAFVGLISASNGSLTLLKSLASWGTVGGMAFSHDGKRLAYDVRAGENAGQHDVFVLAVDGSRESSIVAQPADDRVVDWAEDTVLFTSDRSGATGLWAVPGSGGVAREIRPNVSGRGFITDSGTLFMGSMFALRDVFTATMNFDNGQIDADAVNPVPKFIGANRMPRWSPDGKSMAFLSTRKGYENSLVGILSNETAQVREIGEGMATIWQMRWAPNGKSIYVSGNSTKGQPGIYRMDARGGALPELVVPDANDTRHSLDVSADGTKLYYLLGAGGGGGTLVEWSLSESKGREVLALKGMDFLSVSPDGKWIAARVPNPSEEESALWVAPIRGGASRQLFSGMTRYAFVSWADAESMIVQKGDENWQVFLSDRAPRKLPIPLGQGPVHVHPDGKQIAFWRDVSRAELSVLENFLP